MNLWILRRIPGSCIVALAVMGGAAACGKTERPNAQTVADSSATSPAFRYDQHVGLATFRGGRNGCLTIANASLEPGKRLTLVLVNQYESSRVYDARVVAKADSACGWISVGAEGMSPAFYRIERTNDTTVNDVAFAVVDPVAPITIRSGLPVGDVDGDGALEVFHSCTSSETVHYRVWTGPVIEGRVRWNGRRNVDYDMVHTCPDLAFFATAATGPPIVAREPTPEPEGDILEMAKERPLGVRVDGQLARYGDPVLAAAVDHLSDVPHPWTVPQFIRLFNQTSSEWLRKLEATRAARRNEMWPEWRTELQRRQDLARILAASRDPRAALALGRTLDDTARTASPPGRELTFGPPLGGEFPNAVAIFEAIFDYYVADINYGLPPEEWQGVVAGKSYDFTVPAVRRWWAANRVRLEAMTGG